MKPTLIYLNQDCYTQVDDTVLHHLSRDFRVIWFYIHESMKSSIMRYTPEKAKEYAEKNGFEVRIYDPKCRNRNIKNISFYFMIANEINSLNPDIVYSAHRDPYWAMAVYCKIKCKNVVLGVHDVQTHSYNFSMNRFLEAVTKNFSLKVHSKFITFSKGQQDLLKIKFGKDSCMVGMSLKDFGMSKLNPGSLQKGVKLLFFGSIHEYKGLDLLINAIENLYNNGTTNLHLTIAGRGPYWSTCEKLIKITELYDLKVRFIDNAEIPDLMSSHHFLVLPYRDATQSGPLVAAIAYELPIIAPDYGCFRETYNDESAILYASGGLCDALLHVSQIKQDEYNDIKQACKLIKEANSEEQVASNYINFFSSLLHFKEK